MAATFVAQAGDSLCSIAFMHGMADCAPLRSEPANAAIVNRATDPAQVLPGDVVTIPDFTEKQESGGTEQTHNFVVRGRLASIRFVHGSPNLPYQDDPTLAVLDISNYVTTRAGNPDGSAVFPNTSVRRFNADAHQDVDTFKVEVLDIRAAGNLQVDLEVLRPVYTAGVVTSHTSFPAAIGAARKLTGVVAAKQGGTQRFRTCYLRLVTDEDDVAAAPQQVLLASDMHDAGDSQVEILDQIVKASYTIPSCPQNPKCKAMTTIPIGTDRQRIRLALHVLRLTPGGALVVPLAAADRRVFMWFRRVFAQAGVGPKLVQAARAIDPPENLISISNDDTGAGHAGLTAAGDGPLTFRINATGQPSQTITVNPAAGDTPLTTANAIVARIAAPFAATAPVVNAPRFNDLVGQASVDFLITEAGGARVTIDAVVSGDTRQSLSVGRAAPANFLSWNGNNFLVGSIEQRAVLRNFDTGDDRIDLFVVQNVTAGNRAEAMMSGHRVDPNRPAVPQIKNSVFLTASTMDATNGNPYVLAHEVGHVVGEVVHAPAAAPPNNAQVMERQGTEVATSVNGSKRIRDSAVTYDRPAGNFNLVARLRIEGAPLLEGW